MERLIEILRSIIGTDRWLFVAGNGGSAANASHFVTDLMKSCDIRALSLTDNTPLITMLANDYGYEHIFDKQLQRYLRPVDVLLVLSVSGKSHNIIRALDYANMTGCRTIALTGRDGINGLADLVIQVPDDQPELVEDAHLRILHQIAMELRNG